MRFSRFSYLAPVLGVNECRLTKNENNGRNAAEAAQRQEKNGTGKHQQKEGSNK